MKNFKMVSIFLGIISTLIVYCPPKEKPFALDLLLLNVQYHLTIVQVSTLDFANMSLNDIEKRIESCASNQQNAWKKLKQHYQNPTMITFLNHVKEDHARFEASFKTGQRAGKLEALQARRAALRQRKK